VSTAITILSAAVALHTETWTYLCTGWGNSGCTPSSSSSSSSCLLQASSVVCAAHWSSSRSMFLLLYIILSKENSSPCTCRYSYLNRQCFIFFRQCGFSNSPINGGQSHFFPSVLPQNSRHPLFTLLPLEISFVLNILFGYILKKKMQFPPHWMCPLVYTDQIFVPHFHASFLHSQHFTAEFSPLIEYNVMLLCSLNIWSTLWKYSNMFPFYKTT